MFKKYILFLGFVLFSTNLFAAQTQIAQIKSQKVSKFACKIASRRNSSAVKAPLLVSSN